MKAEPRKSEARPISGSRSASAPRGPGWTPDAPLRAQPCSCIRPLVIPPGPECAYCGRDPRAAGGPRFVKPVQARIGCVRSRTLRCGGCGEPLAREGRLWICGQVMCRLFGEPQGAHQVNRDWVERRAQ